MPVGADAPVVAPVSAHVNLVTPQLSPVVGFGVTTEAVQVPALTLAVMFPGHVMVGGVVSVTLTVAVHVAILPLGSVTVTVTVLAPMSEQSKTLGKTLIVATPQLSLLDETT
jgi:hypothetical protein